MKEASPIYMPQGTTNTIEKVPRLLPSLINKIKAFNEIEKENNLSELQLLVYNMIVDENLIDQKDHATLKWHFEWKLIKNHMLEFFRKMGVNKHHISKQVIDDETYSRKDLSGGENALITTFEVLITYE